MTKQQSLDKIAREIEQCSLCKIGKSGKAVPGEGNPDAAVVFIGEAPGKQEAQSGRPFIGRSGQLLRKLIRSIGLDDEKDVYITSPVKYLPDRGTPSSEDITHGREHLMKQLDIINPRIIVLLGRVAAEGVLQNPTSSREAGLRGARKVAVAKEHGQVIAEEGNRKYFLTYHPAAALRFQKNMEPLKEDFARLKTLLI